jgi:hypothetical protein
MIFNSVGSQFTPHTAIGLKKDTVFILFDDYGLSQTALDHTYGYDVSVMRGDTLIDDSFYIKKVFPIVPDIPNKKSFKPLNPWNKKSRDLDIYIYDTYQHKFNYAEIPDTIAKLFPDVEHINNGNRYLATSTKITASLYAYKDSIAACYVSDTSFRKLYVYDFTTKSNFSIDI